MSNNLIVEFVKRGVQPRNIAKTISEILGVSEKTARNKINGVTDWTLPEAMQINEKMFDGALSIEYLFKQEPETA